VTAGAEGGGGEQVGGDHIALAATAMYADFNHVTICT